MLTPLLFNPEQRSQKAYERVHLHMTLRSRSCRRRLVRLSSKRSDTTIHIDLHFVLHVPRAAGKFTPKERHKRQLQTQALPGQCLFTHTCLHAIAVTGPTLANKQSISTIMFPLFLANLGQ